MENVHEPLDVPVVLKAGAAEDTVSFVDFVLTTALAEAPALIEAEWVGPAQNQVLWTARKYGDTVSFRIVGWQEGTYFRSTLARIGFHLLNGQMYGGAIRRYLRQGERKVIAAIHTSNDQATGYWVRIALGRPSEAST